MQTALTRGYFEVETYFASNAVYSNSTEEHDPAPARARVFQTAFGGKAPPRHRSGMQIACDPG
jgi:hypothetical protein